MASFTLGLTTSGDYAAHSPVNGDNAGPAIDALVHGHLATMASQQPLMGLTSLILRAPFAALGGALGAGPGLVYGLGALACLLPLILLGAWMVGRPAPLERRFGALIAAGIIVAGPATVEAVRVGHPEELLAAVLATTAVLAAVRGRPGWAWPLLGMAVGTKQWALLAAPCVLLALPDRRIAVAVKAGALALALSATLPLVDPAAFTRAASSVGSVRFANPFGIWWPFGTPIGAAGHSAFAPTAHLLPFGLPRSEAAAAGLVLVIAALWLYRSRSAERKLTIDPLALLALLGLARCVTDPDPLQYYFVAVLIPLAVWETVMLGRLPLLTAAAAGAVAILARGLVGSGAHFTPVVLSALSIGWSVALGVYLARRVARGPILAGRLWPNRRRSNASVAR
ncbi:MAG: hypothetical protein ACYDHH_06330 [Solirubrobacteraceae bacterium]